MFGSAVLDVAIGLVFIFLLLSIICSAANELIELGLKKRSRDLERGIAELIGDPANTTAFMTALYNHGLINALYRGSYVPQSRQLPAYIPASNFALALLDLCGKLPAAPGATLNIPGNVASALKAFETIADAGGKKLQESVEGWFNSAMDRVSGFYKRRTQIFILVMGLAIAVFVNADCVEIAQHLSSDASLRQGVVALAEATAKNPPAPVTQTKDASVDSIRNNIKSLEGLGLPFGWPEKTDSLTWDQRALYALSHHFFGWILTALAVSLGAPFWFDVLNKIMVIRSSVKPHEKSPEEGSKDKSAGKAKAATT